MVSEFVLLWAEPSDSGVYHCSASNPAGVASANLTLTVVEELTDVDAGSNDGQKRGEGTLKAEEEEEEESMIKVKLFADNECASMHAALNSQVGSQSTF